MFISHLYSKKKSNFFTIIKQLRELLFALVHNNFFKENGTVWISPYFPSRKTTLYQISRKLKFNLVTAPMRNTKVGINFNDSTFQKASNSYPQKVSVINKNIYDISKKNVDEKHLAIFGYNTIIDPQHHSGHCVVKSNDNALHDGIITKCPVQNLEEDKVYQILIDNQEEQLFVDYRICVMKSDIIITYKKFKTKELRFTNDTCKAEICENEIIPEDIRKKIVTFCKIMDAEFCELDVLKDNGTNQWYIIDLNKTPYGPPASLSKKDKKKAVEILSNGFYKNFLNQ
jgi:hypothetical protein